MLTKNSNEKEWIEIDSSKIFKPISCEPSTITFKVNKDYYRERFKKVFEKWDYEFWGGFDKEYQNRLLDDLLQCFDEEGE